MKFPKFASATMVAAAMLLTVTACGTDDSDAPPTVETTASSSAPAQANGGVEDPSTYPSVETLNQMLDTALDPKVPNSEKTKLVQGSEKDPKIFDELVKARKENPDVTYKLTKPIIPAGPNKARVKVKVATPGNPPTTVDATIVYTGGRWKLSNETVCTLLNAYDVKSAMCKSTSASPSKRPN